MVMLLDKGTKIMVQGITGRAGKFHTKRMLDYGSKIVAGVTPGKGGMEVCGVPVYDTVSEVLEEIDVDASIVFVPAKYASNAILEAIECGLKLIVVITEHIPLHDSIRFVRIARDRGVRIVGPNSPGIISPGRSMMGIMPPRFFKEGNVGLVSRSGTLTYEIAFQMTKEGFGQSTCIGIGGDAVTGMNFVEVLEMFERDPDTKKIVMVGEIGGMAEENAAKYIEDNVSKPVFSYIAGLTAPREKRMGHAGAIIMGRAGGAKNKINALERAGVFVARRPSDIIKGLEES
ncbi:MAG: succinate--CoA ligase subunit alpha [Candidatus Odinarchaeota archaeon]|nr:succinate--CoA ligase subunit alpha [Candidatus Odinarchaeota archaeon]